MKRLIFATGNQNKMREIREILADLPVEILSMKEAGSKRILWKTEKPLRKMPSSRQKRSWN